MTKGQKAGDKPVAIEVETREILLLVLLWKKLKTTIL